MVMLRVLITGAEGQLGQALMANQPDNIEFIGCSKAELDITNINQIEKIFLSKKPHIVINCAAYTAVDKAEQDEEQAYLVNEQGVKNLAKVCKRKNIKVIHLSTDYVFSGKQAVPYTANDCPQPINVYGQSKLAGEHALQLLGNNGLIIRSSWLISTYGHNFFNTILSALKNNQELQIVDDQYGTPTNADQLAAWIIATLPLFWHGTLTGIYHAAAATSCSWYQLAQEIRRVALEQQLLAHSATLTAISSAAFKQQKSYAVAPRPDNSALCPKQFLEAVNLPSMSWQAMVKECFNHQCIK